MSDLDKPIRIGTRGSDLALWQSNHVKALLKERFGPRLDVELEIITTKGDQILDRPLHEVGGKGLFVKGIEAKLIEGTVDLAVHSMKDMPALGPEALVVGCTPSREDPRDALVGGAGSTLAGLAPGTKVGTGSLRRGALVRRLNPSVEVVPIRGNVPTRVGMVDSGEVDAVILAAAGLRRLGLGGRIVEALDPDSFCPAPTQGILALQCRRDDERMRRLLAPLSDPLAIIAATVERAFLERLEAGCTVPVGCHATVEGDRVAVHALVIAPAGDPCYETRDEAPVTQAQDLGTRVAELLLSRGADRIVARDPR